MTPDTLPVSLPPLPGKVVGFRSEVMNALVREYAEAYARANMAALQERADALEAALKEAMHQATTYDGLDLTKIGPKHWYQIAARAITGDKT